MYTYCIGYVTSNNVKPLYLIFKNENEYMKENNGDEYWWH